MNEVKRYDIGTFGGVSGRGNYIMVSQNAKGYLREWRGYWFKGPCCGITDKKSESKIYSEKEIAESLYISDGIAHGIFEKVAA